MDQLDSLLKQHVALLQARCEHLEKNICAVSNANAALEKAFSIPARIQVRLHHAVLHPVQQLITE